MSKITGSSARSLMEAYSSVYAPQEITEEQIREQVEAWVNALLEEGHDLSEFTWEDMYEAYIEEQGGTNRRGQGATSGAAQSQALQNLGQSFKSFADRGGVAGAINRALQSASQRNGNPDRRGQGSTSGATVRRPQPAPTNTTRPAPTNTTRPAPTNTTRPAPVANSGAAKPAPVAGAPVAAAPVAAKPAVPSTSVAGTFKPVAGAPTQASLATARPAPEKANILGNKPSELAALQAKAKADTLAKTKTVAARPMGARERMLNQDLDLFDVVKGHLLDEGYADTEEAALAIMSNMSEEWRNQIIESSCGGGHPKKKKKKSGY